MKVIAKEMYQGECFGFFKDEETGDVWRIFGDNCDGTCAVEEVTTGEHPEPVYGRPCGVLVFTEEGGEITRCSSHGENHTEGSKYLFGHEVLVATPSGWEPIGHEEDQP